MRILICQFGHETNTFAADRTDKKRFAEMIWQEGAEILSSRSADGTDYISGMMKAAEELGLELVPTFCAFNVGGLILADAYNEIKQNILSGIAANYQNADGICLSLHGAAAVEGTDDPERDLLEAIRALVGPGMPITASFDLHGNISAESMALLNGAVAVKEYPHTDSHIAGYRAMEILHGILTGQPAYVAWRRVPMLLACATGCTLEGPAREAKEHFAAYCADNGLLDCSFFHGFPYADLPIAGSSVVVTARNQEGAEAAAQELADYVWQRRADFVAGYPSAAEALDTALAMEGGPIVVNETSDNPGGGTPADGTHLLREMLDRNVPGTCFGYLYDPEFVQAAIAAGVGATFSAKLGGKTDELHGPPLDVTAYVKCLTDGKFIMTSPVMGKGRELSLGLSCRVRIGNVDVIVASVRFQTLDDRLFLLHGIDIADYKVVALKSTQHFKGVFQHLAKAIVTADPPGIHTANFSLLQYNRVSRPIYPLDDF